MAVSGFTSLIIFVLAVMVLILAIAATFGYRDLSQGLLNVLPSSTSVLVVTSREYLLAGAIMGWICVLLAFIVLLLGISGHAGVGLYFLLTTIAIVALISAVLTGLAATYLNRINIKDNATVPARSAAIAAAVSAALATVLAAGALVLLYMGNNNGKIVI